MIKLEKKKKDNTFLYPNLESGYGNMVLKDGAASSGTISLEMKKVGSEVDPEYSGVLVYAVNIQYTIAMPKMYSQTTLVFQSRKPGGSWQTRTPILDIFGSGHPARTITKTVNALDYVGVGEEYRLALILVDGSVLDETPQTFYSGTPITNIKLFNHETFNKVDGSNPLHFDDVIRFEYSGPSGVTPIAQYSRDGINWADLPGQPTISEGKIVYRGIANGPNEYGKLYLFRLRYLAARKIVYTEPAEMTRVPQYDFSTVVYSHTRVSVVDDFTSRFEIRLPEIDTEGLISSYSIPSWSTFNYYLVHGGMRRRLVHEMDSTIVNRIFSITYKNLYPYDSAIEENSLTNNPFNLEFNQMYSMSIVAEITDAFGRTYSKTLNPLEISLRKSPSWGDAEPEGWIKTRNHPDLFLDYPSVPGEMVELKFPVAISKVGTQLLYRIIEDGKIKEEFRYPAGNKNNPNDFITRTVQLPATDADSKIIYYRVEARDGSNPYISLNIPYSVELVRYQNPIFNTFRIVENEPGELEAQIRLQDLGAAPHNIGAIQLTIQSSISPDFSQMSSQVLLVSVNLLDKTRLLDSVQTFSVENKYPNHTGAIYYRAELRTTPLRDNSTVEGKGSFSSVYSDYGDAPTFSYRKGRVGINSNNFNSDTAFLVSASKGRNIVEFVGASSTIKINLENGEVDGVIIDGGTW